MIQQRRARGRLRRLTDEDRAKKAARNQRRHRVTANVMATEPEQRRLTAVIRPTADPGAVVEHKGVKSLLGYNVRRRARAERRRGKAVA